MTVRLCSAVTLRVLLSLSSRPLRYQRCTQRCEVLHCCAAPCVWVWHFINVHVYASHQIHAKSHGGQGDLEQTLSSLSWTGVVGCSLLPAKSMWPLACVISFKYVAILLNQCLTETAGNSPGHLLCGWKVRACGLISRAGRYPLQALPEQQRDHWAFPKDFRALLSLRSSHKPRGTCPLSPQLLLSKMQRLEGLHKSAAPQGKLHWWAASRGSPRRRAEGGIQTATCFWRHKTCLYNDILATTSVIWNIALCLSQTLSLEQQKGGWQNQLAFASITTGNVGSGRGNDLSSVYAPGTNVWPAQALSSSYFSC